jgi:hypothetical protein
MAPARVCPGTLEMKMWNISVAPIPSIMSMPVVSNHNWRVVCGTTGSGKTRLLHALAASLEAEDAARLREAFEALSAEESGRTRTRFFALGPIEDIGLGHQPRGRGVPAHAMHSVVARACALWCVAAPMRTLT